MSQRLVTITVLESDSQRVVDRVLSFAWVQGIDLYAATRLLVNDAERIMSNSSWSEIEPEKSLSVVRINFKVRATHLGATIKALRSDGIGSEFGTIDVTDIRVSTEALPRVHQRAPGGWFRSLTDRLSTLEIHETIAMASHMTADHVASVLVASFVAAIGLLTDGTTVVLAAFFISPLMSMVVGATWGAAVSDSRMVKRSLKNLATDAGLAIGVGAFVAFILGFALPYQPHGVTAPVHSGSHGVWNAVSVSTDEILNRGPPRSNLVIAAFVAAFSGIAVALGHVGGLPSALAGVALSTALLPPLVNAGLMLGLSLFYPRVKNSRGDSLRTVAAYSSLIYIININFIAIFAYITLKLKRVGGRTLRAAKRDFAVSRQDWRCGENIHDNMNNKEDEASRNSISNDTTQLNEPLLRSNSVPLPPSMTWQSPALSTAALRRRILSPDDVKSPPTSPTLTLQCDHEPERNFSSDHEDNDGTSPIRSTTTSVALTPANPSADLDAFAYHNNNDL